MGIQPTNEPTFEITCDRCGAVWHEVGSTWRTHSVTRAEREPSGFLQAVPNIAQKVLCNPCGESYQQWWAGSEIVSDPEPASGYGADGNFHVGVDPNALMEWSQGLRP